ncbi:MAG: HEAT repeat domain-containing protein, partial [Planctomycetota bacterium]
MKKRMILSLVWVLVLGTTFLFGGITDEYRKARELKDKAGANTVEAVKEIIPYLGDPKPIYRDGAYQALRYNITDEKAIQLMAQELLRNRNVLVRENLAEILGYIGKNQKELVGKALLRSLTRDPKLSVRIEAARALGRLQYEPAVKALEKIFKRFNRKTWLLRGEALNSLFLIKGKDALPWVEKGLKDKDYIIRAYSLRLLGKIDSSKALDAAMEVLKKTKPKKIFIKGWQPVYVAFRIVLQSSQDKNVNLPKLREAITLIIELLKGLKGRIFYNAIQTLEKITGEKNIIPSYRDWRDYWAVNKDRFVPKPLKKDDNTEGKRPTTVLRYHGAPLYSTRVVFLVDHSGSMKNRLGEGDNKGKIKFDVCKSELVKIIKG